MFKFLKELLKKEKEHYFSISEAIDFRGAIRFKQPDGTIINKIRGSLQSLEEANLKLEQPLKHRKATIYTSIEALLASIQIDLEGNYKDYILELKNEDLDFEYYLSQSCLFSNSVEIIQRIYSLNTKTGDLYNALVIKHYNGSYYYWPW
jgi:hypothetical protein